MKDIMDFWKLQPRKTNKIKILRKGRSFENVFAEVSFIDKSIKPKWLEREKIKLILPKIWDVRTDEEVLMSFNLKGRDIPGIIRDGEEIVFTFDPDDTVDNLIYEKYLGKIRRPAFTYSPIKYYHFPKSVRNGIFRTGMKIKKLSPDKGFPRWPVEKSVELIRQLFLNSLKLVNNVKTKKFWPGNKKFAAGITHDIESKSGFVQAEKFLEIEDSVKIKSSWNMVTNRYKIDFEVLRKIKEMGFEIGCHGFDHSGELPYLDEKEIDRRLNASFKKLKEFKVSGFRSPQLQRNSRLMKKVARIFDYDSSVPDTEIFSPFKKRSGCCTVFPFDVYGMIELPVTMPQDYTMMLMKFDEKKMVKYWDMKLEWIEKVGGLAIFNFHPDDYIFGNDECLKVYESVLKKLKRRKVWISLPSDIVKWWKKR